MTEMYKGSNFYFCLKKKKKGTDLPLKRLKLCFLFCFVFFRANSERKIKPKEIRSSFFLALKIKGFILKTALMFVMILYQINLFQIL